MAAPGHDFARLFIELGLLAVGLALLARVANRWGFSSISLFLLAGLAFGKGGFAPLNLSRGFIQLGAEIGVLLLLFMLGLEYSGEQLRSNLRSGAGAAALDFLLNFPPGVVAGLLLGWSPIACVLLGGVTYVSSSGIIARVLSELGRTDFPETPSILSILVMEDLVMAVYLPLIAVLIAGGGPAKIVLWVGIACVSVLAVLFIATRFGNSLSAFIAHQSDEVILLTVFGTVLCVAGARNCCRSPQRLAPSWWESRSPARSPSSPHCLLAPLRDLFAATFFLFFGLEIDPHSLPSVLPVALALAAATTVTKALTGFWATQK